MIMPRVIAMLALGLLVPVSGCAAGGAATAIGCAGTAVAAAKDAKTIALTVKSAKGSHAFAVEIAATEEAQQRGLMFRTDIPVDGGMLFFPYPPEGGAPREASFWMKNTPTALDIIYIRPDNTIATIAENTVPFSEMPIPSGAPVCAVLEIRGGRSAELGIVEGDSVSWASQPQAKTAP